MRAVIAAPRLGLPATVVVRLSAEDSGQKGGVSASQREPRPIAAILPQVLARYGLSEAAESPESHPRQLDLFA